MRICEQGCENLAIAIIRQAVNDYRNALNMKENRVKKECEDFFSSDFFCISTRFYFHSVFYR